MDRGDYYKRALEGDCSGWDHPDAPWPGFYRVRFSRLDYWRPVAIWDVEPGLTVATVGEPTGGRAPFFHAKPRGARIAGLWLNCWRHPVTREQHDHALLWGSWWDSVHAEPERRGEQGRLVVDITDAAPIPPPQRKEV